MYVCTCAHICRSLDVEARNWGQVSLQTTLYLFLLLSIKFVLWQLCTHIHPCPISLLVFWSTDFNQDHLCWHVLEPCGLTICYTMKADNSPLPRINPLPTVYLGVRGYHESFPTHDWRLSAQSPVGPVQATTAAVMVFARLCQAPTTVFPVSPLTALTLCSLGSTAPWPLDGGV